MIASRGAIGKGGGGRNRMSDPSRRTTPLLSLSLSLSRTEKKEEEEQGKGRRKKERERRKVEGRGHCPFLLE